MDVSDARLRMECLQLAGLYGADPAGNIALANQFAEFVLDGKLPAKTGAPRASPGTPVNAVITDEIAESVTPLNKRGKVKHWKHWKYVSAG